MWTGKDFIELSRALLRVYGTCGQDTPSDISAVVYVSLGHEPKSNYHCGELKTVVNYKKVKSNRINERFGRTSAHSTLTPIDNTKEQNEFLNGKALWISNLNLRST